MTQRAVDELPDVLADLDGLIARDRPELYERLGPGLSAEDLEQLGKRLHPYHLPIELVLLYRWHDGWEAVVDDEYLVLLPSAAFNSLTDAIVQYELWWQTLGQDGWHPLWFPAFGDQSGELVGLQLQAGQAADRVYAFHSSEAELFPAYDSVTSLFATALECWQAGVLPHEHSSLPAELRRITARHNPRSRTADGAYREPLSRWSTERWPRLWREVLDLGPMTQAPESSVVTIAQFVADPESARPIRAELRGWGGSADTLVAVAADGSGALHVLLTRTATENFRELRGGRRYEISLVPLHDREPVDELAANMRRIAEVPQVSYLATRIVPL